MTKPILSVVRYTENAMTWDSETMSIPNAEPDPDRNKYIASGGNIHSTPDLQKAQIFGFSKRAQQNLNKYRNNPNYEVIPIKLVIDHDINLAG